MQSIVRPVFVALLSALPCASQEVAGWPSWVRGVEIPRSVDVPGAGKAPGGGEVPPQAAVWWAPEQAEDASGKPVPLVVALHTWSGDWRQTDPGVKAAQQCRDRGWAFVHPDFGGPNRTPEACGSERMVQDVLDAVDWARGQARIDDERIFLFGGSGGGHAALLLAARAPERWAGVSAWVPIVELAQWHRECRERKRYGRYADDLEQACGGAPGDDAVVDREYASRSPLPILARARGIPIDLHAGVRDGHEGSVPIRHVLQAFDALADAEQRVGEELREELVAAGDVPEELRDDALEAGVYAAKRPLWRRSSHNVRVTLFDGGHEILVDVAFDWLGDVAAEVR